jgi:subtilase family serine protease
MYDSVSGGWIVVAGTSASAPIVAALFAEAHDYPSAATGAASIYARSSALYGLPAGSYTQGTPHGLGAF